MKLSPDMEIGRYQTSRGKSYTNTTTNGIHGEGIIEGGVDMQMETADMGEMNLTIIQEF